MTRIFQASPLESRATLRLNEKASHHLANVLRAKVGDTLTVFNGQGCEHHAVIQQINKKSVEVELLDLLPNKSESPIRICLAQGIARGEKMDYIVQKAVELGVHTVMPLVTERCNVRLQGDREEKRIQHWQAVVVSACEQSGRSVLPEVMSPMTLAEWLPTVSADKRFVLSPHVSEKMPTDDLPANASIVLLIGPEGGLSDQEVALAQQYGFLPLNLGPRVLRTETAALAAVTVLQYRYGDLS